MARIRTVKPEFWTDGRMVKLSPLARLLYIGSWNFALCDQGHLPADAMGLKLKVLPADQADADELVDELLGMGRFIPKMTTDGRAYWHIVRLSEHQKVDARWQTRCPYCLAESEAAANGSPEPPPNSSAHAAPPQTSASLPETPASHDESHPNSAQESKGKESKGSTKNSSSPAPPPRDPDATGDLGDEDPGTGELPGMPRAPEIPKPPEPGTDEDPDWVKLWSIFPNGSCKADARKAYARAVKKAAPFVIIAGAERYRDLVTRQRREKRHIAHASSWLNGERWNDEITLPDEPASGSQVPPRNGYKKEDYV